VEALVAGGVSRREQQRQHQQQRQQRLRCHGCATYAAAARPLVFPFAPLATPFAFAMVRAGRVSWLSVCAYCSVSVTAVVLNAAGLSKRLAFMLSVWSACGTAGYFEFASYAESRPKPDTLLLALRAIALCHAVPLAVLTCAGFWLVCAWDRELLYPAVLGSLNSASNHALHTLPALLMGAEWLSLGRPALRCPPVLPLLYVAASLFFRAYTGGWQYKLFTELAPWGLLGLAALYSAAWRDAF
jgi:hypothetical protein